MSGVAIYFYESVFYSGAGVCSSDFAGADFDLDIVTFF